MKKIKELTIKEKILKSLEEPNENNNRLIGGFTSILLALSIANASLDIQVNTLKEVGVLK